MNISNMKPRTVADISHEEAVAELNRIQRLPTLDEASARAALTQECAWLARNGQQERGKRILAAFDAFSTAAKAHAEAELAEGQAPRPESPAASARDFLAMRGGNEHRLYRPPFRYDEECYIWDSKGLMVCEVRGAGLLGSHMRLGEAHAFQDALGEQIVKALNEAWPKPEPPPRAYLDDIVDESKRLDAARADGVIIPKGQVPGLYETPTT